VEEGNADEDLRDNNATRPTQQVFITAPTSTAAPPGALATMPISCQSCGAHIELVFERPAGDGNS
jgi:hypothetical protein